MTEPTREELVEEARRWEISADALDRAARHLGEASLLLDPDIVAPAFDAVRELSMAASTITDELLSFGARLNKAAGACRARSTALVARIATMEVPT